MGHSHEHAHSDNECCSSENKQHNHDVNNSSFQLFLPAIVSFVLLLVAIVLDYFVQPSWFTSWIRIAWYVVAYLPVGFPVVKEAVESIQSGAVFSEFFLMTIATIGAFGIGEYPEAVAVMLFYAVGEAFQDIAVSKVKGNIQSLLDQRPDEVTVVVDGRFETMHAKDVATHSIIQLKPGEKVALDGELLSPTASFNTAALTGESVPDTKNTGDEILAGMLNLATACQIRVTKAYNDSKLSKILELVQNASSQKAPTELFIRKFSRIYTPIVVLAAVLICLIPFFFVDHYVFSEWLYRSLIFLVISCPCALVISIPLGYFGGIGAASRAGILIKGSNYLDLLAKVDIVVMDKTGTLTEGVFKVQEVVFNQVFDQQQMLAMVNAVENLSSHPIATAIHEYVGVVDTTIALIDTEEIAGHGIKTTINGKELLVGNFKLLQKFAILFDTDPATIVYTTIAVAYDGQYVGYITIADTIKADAANTIQQLSQLGVESVMLSGDKSTVVNHVATTLHIHKAYGDLLPINKVDKVKALKTDQKTIAFVGDGLNDAPVIALSDIGIAMGGLGSDVSIEAADVIIQDDKPSKIPTAIRIGKATKNIVWQNIGLAFGVKLIVLALGAGGIATMWEAVFADVGVALLAILNAVRIQRMSFH
ncbi:MAG: cadmium-translocating P-type ATPase [Crocinitomicaceae bacterium]|nr:cadmium-translocating P-type ATPase [Crocinitomicaceae bacterium]